MAALKIPLQVSCPNCQAGNLPGSPYCGRCGAPLEGIAAGSPPAGPSVSAGAADPMKRFAAEGQDPVVVQLAYARASDILTTGETIEYVAVANKGSLTHAPDCAVATNKRIILYRKKVLGKVEQDEFIWRDVRNAALKDGRGAVTFTLEAIQGWQMAIEALPKAQAWRLYELAVAHSPKLAETLLRSTGPMDPGLTLPDGPLVPHSSLELPPTFPAPVPTPAPAPAPLRLPAQQFVNPLPAMNGAAAYEEHAPSTVQEPAPASPTPESVLQAILQQAARDNGAPTRPMPLSAAAFQAPVADAQPVTFSESTPDFGMRSMPRLNSLEQIAVFTGPLTGGLLPARDDSPGSPNELTPSAEVQGTRTPPPTGLARSSEDAYAQLVREYGPPADTTPTAPNSSGALGATDYAEEPMPLPGSMSSGPLLEAAYENGPPVYPEEMVSGGLDTQNLYSHRAGDAADRITSTSLNGQTDGRGQAGGRSRRPAGVSRPQITSAARNRQAVARPETDDPVQKMKQLKAMLDAGLIDGADYEVKKAEILSRL